MLIVPVQAVPSQTLTVTLAGQPTQLNIYTMSGGAGPAVSLFMDVYVSGSPIITSVICQNANRIIRDLYLGYIGDFAWFDTQPQMIHGVSTPADPYYTGLGSRWILAYLTPTDLGGRG